MTIGGARGAAMRMRRGVSRAVVVAVAVAVAVTGPAAAAAAPGEGSAPPPIPAPGEVSRDAVPVEAETEILDVAEEGVPAAGPSGADRVVVPAEVPALAVVGVTWDGPADTDVTIRLRSLESGSWTPWSEVEVEVEGPAGGRPGSAPVAVLDATRVEVELAAQEPGLLADARVHIVDPGRSDADDDPTPAPATTLGGGRTAPYPMVAAVTGVPTVRGRAEWGADETIRTKRPELGRVTGAVIHHTAGRNDYTAAEVPAIIRGIYRFHTVDRAWGDIGYNAVVDRFGRIWEGRFGGLTHPLVGAHASGVNSTMVGISLMGDFSTEPVPDVAMRATAQVTAWKLAVHGVPPSGSAVAADGRLLDERIIGHRDVNTTACPGETFYARMDEFRDLVETIYPSMPTYVQPNPHPVRLAGADRYATSAATSAWIFPRQDVVYVATGAEYADALAASPAAALTGSPVLLVRPTEVPAATVAEITRLRPTTIRVLGGVSAVSPAALAELRALAGTVDVVAGADRYETAARTSLGSWEAGAETVYLASGQSAPDALGAAAAAAEETSPLLLVKQDGLPEATSTELTRLAPARVVVVGGEAVVGAGVVADVADLLPDADIDRVGGVDRYATSALLVAGLWEEAGAVFHATGVTWPDALSASSAAAEKGAPLLLVKTSCAPSTVLTVRDSLDPVHAYVVGGPAAVVDGAPARGC